MLIPPGLVTADVERIDFTVEKIHSLWASVIEIGIAIYLLEREMGWAFFAPVFVALGMILFYYFSFARNTSLRYDKSLHALNYLHLQIAAQSSKEVESSNTEASGFDIDNAKQHEDRQDNGIYGLYRRHYSSCSYDRAICIRGFS